MNSSLWCTGVGGGGFFRRGKPSNESHDYIFIAAVYLMRGEEVLLPKELRLHLFLHLINNRKALGKRENGAPGTRQSSH